jgi:hypothetical protein
VEVVLSLTGALEVRFTRGTCRFLCQMFLGYSRISGCLDREQGPDQGLLMKSKELRYKWEQIYHYMFRLFIAEADTGIFQCPTNAGAVMLHQGLKRRTQSGIPYIFSDFFHIESEMIHDTPTTVSLLWFIAVTTLM